MSRVVQHRAILFVCAVAAFACEKDREKDRGEQAGANAVSENEQVTAGKRPPTIVFLGDSLTAGRGLSREEAMPALIEEEIEASGLDFEVINAGRSGDTTAGGLARMSWYLRDDVNLAVLVIGLGSNDAMRGIELEEIEKNLRAIAKRAREYDPAVKVLLFEMKTFPNMGEDYAGAYEEIFARVAEETETILLPFPLEGVAANPQLNQPDGIHPNREGTRIVAENVWKALEPHLR